MADAVPAHRRAQRFDRARRLQLDDARQRLRQRVDDLVEAADAHTTAAPGKTAAAVARELGAGVQPLQLGQRVLLDRNTGMLAYMNYIKRWLFTGEYEGQNYERAFFGDVERLEQRLVNTNAGLLLVGIVTSISPSSYCPAWLRLAGLWSDRCSLRSLRSRVRGPLPACLAAP